MTKLEPISLVATTKYYMYSRTLRLGKGLYFFTVNSLLICCGSLMLSLVIELSGPAKSRNPRNTPKFTKSSVFNRPIVSETYLNQQRQPLTSSDQRTLTVDEIEVASSLNFSILIECSLLNACECVDFVSSTVFRRIRQFLDCLRWI